MVELSSTGLNLVPLMTASEVASFGPRLSLAFALLAGAGVAMAYFWTRLLEVDHTGKRFELEMLVPAFSLSGLAAAFWIWAPTKNGIEGSDIALIAFLALSFAPAFLLRLSALFRGVGGDDRLQTTVLRSFQFLATTTFGLLTAVIGIGVALLYTERISVAFATARGPFYVETKNAREGIQVEDRFGKFGDMWVFKTTAEQGNRIEPTAWFLVANSEIKCFSGPALGGPLPGWRPCAVPGQENRRTGSTIQGYAQWRLGCSSESFAPDHFAAIASFGTDLPEPGNNERATDIKWISTEQLSKRTLEAEADAPDAKARFDAAVAAKTGTTWVLGFASRKGTPSHNADLSKRRAHALSAALGILPQAQRRGLGEENPIAAGDEDAKEQRFAIAFVCL